MVRYKTKELIVDVVELYSYFNNFSFVKQVTYPDGYIRNLSTGDFEREFEKIKEDTNIKR